MDLSGKTILITGAAGRIGSATARMAFAYGADLVLADLSEERLTLLVSELRQAGSQKVYSFPSDITSTKGIDHLFAEIGRSLLTITSAVHCAYPTSSGWGTKVRMFRKRTSIRICRCNLAARFYSLRKYLAIS